MYTTAQRFGGYDAVSILDFMISVNCCTYCLYHTVIISNPNVVNVLVAVLLQWDTDVCSNFVSRLQASACGDAFTTHLEGVQQLLVQLRTLEGIMKGLYSC